MSELTLMYVHGRAIGYARLGTELAASLSRMGIDVYDGMDSPQPSEKESARLLERESAILGGAVPAPRRAKRTNVVCWVSVPTHARGWFGGQVPAIFTMWEAMRLPESFRETLHNFDTVIVPSPHNVELFGAYHPNVHLATLGVDPAVWHYVPRTPPGQHFNFLIGGSGPRKGTDLAVEAFNKCFGTPSTWGDGPIPRLVMKNPKGEDFWGERIERVTGRISDEEEVALYAEAHCYLQPSRGEGFGLQPLQAIAQGCPTILTDAHGHASFAHLGYGISATPKRAEYFIYGDGGDWWEPSLDDLCDRMRWVYDHYDEALAFAGQSARTVERDFTWDTCARQFVDAIGPDRLALPYTGDGDWFSPDVKRYHVVTNRDWRADIAGVEYFFAKGSDYHELADVKRILFECGVLDPRCAEAPGTDSGLTGEQVARLGAYSAAHSHCPTCGQRMGASPTRADELMAGLA